MKQSLPATLQLPFYLWIIGIVPILHLYVENFGMVQDWQVAPTIGAVLAATSVIFVITKRFDTNPHRRAFYLCIGSLVFSLSGHLYVMLYMPRSLLISNIATVVIVGCFCLALRKRLPRGIYARFTKPFNIMSTALLAMNCINLLSLHISHGSYESIVEAYAKVAATQPRTPKYLDSAMLPDIYYIIPDGYPSDASLASSMGYNNVAFTNALKARGFEVAEHAQSNYGATLFSLVTTLNMQYYDHNPTQYSDVDFLRFEIANGAVLSWLLQRGYKVVHFPSGYLTPSPIADINREFTASGSIDVAMEDYFADSSKRTLRVLQSFIPLYIDTTLFRIIRSQLAKMRLQNDTIRLAKDSPYRFLDTIDEVDSITAMPEATFTFIHLMKPHFPTNFDSSGNIIAPIQYPNHEQYFEEFGFVNAKFLELIDKILTGSTNPPVIIFQADHGSYLGSVQKDIKSFSQFDIYSAIYLPESIPFRYPRPYTAINTFPLVLNALFDAKLLFQEDRLIDMLVGFDDPFLTKDVTDSHLHGI